MATMTITPQHIERMHRLVFAEVYPLYLQKVQAKGRTKEEVDTVIFWLTGYDQETLQDQIARQTTFKTFFGEAPAFQPNASKITGVICGYRIEEIEDETVRKARYLDKLVDELARGRTMEKILRT